jgi:hypothetical protein
VAQEAEMRAQLNNLRQELDAGKKLSAKDLFKVDFRNFERQATVAHTELREQLELLQKTYGELLIRWVSI